MKQCHNKSQFTIHSAPLEWPCTTEYEMNLLKESGDFADQTTAFGVLILKLANVSV